MSQAQPGRQPPARPSAPSRFRPHGRTLMWAEGALVHVIAIGPFNREGVDAFSQEMVALYRQLPPGQRFVTITELRETLLATPDAWERLAEHLQGINGSGLPLVATAWVLAPEVEGRSLLLPKVRAIFAGAQRVFEVFETLEQAQDWARRQLPPS